MKLPKIGMRTIKTTLAVTITLIITNILNIGNPFFAVIAAIIVMEPSLSESINSSRTRIYGTIFGAFIALVLSLVQFNQIISITLGVMILIYFSNILKWQSSIRVSTIVLVSILLNYEDGNRFSYAIFRTFDTMMGIAIGLSVNRFIRPPNTLKNVGKYFASVNKQLDLLCNKVIKDEKEKISTDELMNDLYLLEDKHRIVTREIRYVSLKTDDKIRIEKIFLLIEKCYNHLSIIVDLKKGDTGQIYQYHLKEIKKIKSEISREILIEKND